MSFEKHHLRHCLLFAFQAKTIEIATFLAVIILNEGFLPILKLMDVMRVTIDQQAEMYAHSRNEACIRRSERRRPISEKTNERNLLLEMKERLCKIYKRRRKLPFMVLE
ncbi:hypothetical protein ALC62_01863 [Cyphomyrmex costatus]|uniref:Uncharacterized protein n=1 Tax=Cyphomyrmex costatus TaxID=456900 RepID=A0A151INZ5_9HYME|nr:hypothetical protein ALC62_01863 [Cyphomyrmex costatus]